VNINKSFFETNVLFYSRGEKPIVFEGEQATSKMYSLLTSAAILINEKTGRQYFNWISPQQHYTGPVSDNLLKELHNLGVLEFFKETKKSNSRRWIFDNEGLESLILEGQNDGKLACQTAEDIAITALDVWEMPDEEIITQGKKIFREKLNKTFKSYLISPMPGLLRKS